VQVDLLVPVKPLARAKTRLLGAADGGAGAPEAHSRLALALVRDTLAAAARAVSVRRLVATCSDEVVRAVLDASGVEAIADEPAAGLNAALRHGEAMLRDDTRSVAVGALQADLPALRPEELDGALRAGLDSGRRVFCSDRAGTGTTLLVAPPAQRLDPRFGPGSAAAHRAAGADELAGAWPGLRCDVDTVDDLAEATSIGLGRFTQEALASTAR
jgi:2-phospho-L-lactate guanylyltransferase